ncbi:MAG: hypothetical protein ABFS35_23410 [Bacteroidota bacterium]
MTRDDDGPNIFRLKVINGWLVFVHDTFSDNADLLFVEDSQAHWK